MADASITIRVKPEIKDTIQDLIDSGEYRSITDFIDRAIREKLDRINCGIKNDEDILKIIEKANQLQQIFNDHEKRLKRIEDNLD